MEVFNTVITFGTIIGFTIFGIMFIAGILLLIANLNNKIGYPTEIQKEVEYFVNEEKMQTEEKNLNSPTVSFFSSL